MKNGIYILSEKLHSGKTTFLINWIKHRSDISGILTPIIDGKRHFFSIKSEETKMLEVEKSNLKIGKYCFEEKVFQWAIDEIEIALSDDSDFLIIDEIGPLEIRSEQGFHHLIKKVENLKNLNKIIIFVVRDFLVQDFIDKYSFQKVEILPLNFFNNESLETLNGIVLAGGKSSRMQSDKATIKYQNKEQWKVAASLLKSFSNQVFISINEVQSKTWTNVEEKKFVIDAEKFENKGPISGILSVAENSRNVGFFVLGIDYPFLKLENLIFLNNFRSEKHEAICFELDGFLEPLCTIYEKSSIERLQQYFYNGGESLSTFLKTINTKVIDIEDAEFLKNINSTEEYNSVKEKFK